MLTYLFYFIFCILGITILVITTNQRAQMMSHVIWAPGKFLSLDATHHPCDHSNNNPPRPRLKDMMSWQGGMTQQGEGMTQRGKGRSIDRWRVPDPSCGGVFLFFSFCFIPLPHPSRFGGKDYFLLSLSCPFACWVGRVYFICSLCPLALVLFFYFFY